jgi:signal transduction histidine kinase
LSDFTRIDVNTDASPEAELLKAAEMIGCRIVINGDRPTGRKITLLFYAVVREALINAVMHADADRLDIAINPGERGYHVEISDNGTAAVSAINEGNGLTNLRRRLEQDGATLNVKCVGRVTLIAELPDDSKYISA